MPEITGRNITQVLQDKKKIVLEILVGLIVAVSLIGNAWAVWKHYVTKTRDQGFSDGVRTSLTQILERSDGCRPIDVSVDDKSERFVNVKCLQPTGATAVAPNVTAAPKAK